MRQIALEIVIFFGLVSLASASNIDGKIVGRLFLDPLHPAVVWLEGLTTGPASNTESTMAQHGGQFVPAFLIVVQGQTVSMPNEDEVAHNVYSLSDAKQFNLGFYAKGDRRSVTFDRPGLVEVACIIHNFMRAKILVVPNKYYAKAATDGSFHIRNVPAGTFTLKFWTDGVAPISQDVTVPEGSKPLIVRVSVPNAP
jgi:plastocyanin